MRHLPQHIPKQCVHFYVAAGYSPAMASLERVLTVDKPAARVWDYLSDFTSTNDWDPGTVRTVRTAGDGGAGTIDTIAVRPAAGGGTQVTYQVQLSLHGLARLAEPLMARPLEKLGDDAEKSLAQALQQL